MSPADQHIHERFMRIAMELAKKAWGQTHPNPLVGAVVVDKGEIIGQGYHAKAGEPHAEVMALRSLTRPITPESILYVTLEPCCSHGRTPPCTEAIRKAGLNKVVIGAVDPNPVHAGRGHEILRQHGITVVENILSDECADLNLIFNHWIQRRTPFIAAKVATTLDGRVATRTGHSKWITGEIARADVMHWRRYFPAIGVGAGTVLADNPRLTSRREQEEWCPRRFVFDRGLNTLKREELPSLYTDEFRDRTTVIFSTQADEVGRRRLEESGINGWEIPSPDGISYFREIREQLISEGIHGLYIEGGPRLLSEALQCRQLDYLFAYRAPKILADNEARPVFFGGSPVTVEEGFHLTNIKHQLLGDDQLMRGFLKGGHVA